MKGKDWATLFQFYLNGGWDMRAVSQKKVET